MSLFDNWGKGYPWLARHLAKRHAFYSNDINDFLYSLASGRDRKLWDSFAKTDGKTWLRYYRDYRKWEDELSEVVCPSDENRSFASYLRDMRKLFLRCNKEDTIAAFNAMGEKERKELISHLSEISDIRDWLENDLKNDLAGKRDVEEFDQEKLFASPAVFFFLTVWAPCILLYHDQPGLLLRRARNGDLNALCNLLTIDKRVQFDPGIARLLCDLIRDDPGRYKARIVKALGAKHKWKFNRKKIKEFFSALTLKIFEPVCDLNSMDMRRLFDDLAKLQSGYNSSIDNDLQESPEAFSKAVQRKKKDLGKLIPAPGQK